MPDDAPADLPPGAVVATAPDGAALDGLLRLAARVSGAPIALIGIDTPARALRVLGAESSPSIEDFLAEFSDPREQAIADVRADGYGERAFLASHGIRSFVRIPLTTAGGLHLGTLAVFDRSPRSWSADELDAVRLVAVQAATVALAGIESAARDAAAVDERLRAEQSATFTRNIVDSTTNGMVGVGPDGCFTYVNHRMCEITGYDESELLGAPFTILLPPASIPPLMEVFGRLLGGENVRALEVEVVRKDGSVAIHSVSASAIAHEGETRRIAATIEDITERKRTEQLVTTQGSLLELIALGTDLSEVLCGITGAVEEQSNTLCSILLLDEDGETLRPAAAPSVPHAITAAVDGLKIGPAVGSCGTAAFRRETVICADIESDPLWGVDGRELMAGHGIRSCWSTPFFDEHGAVLGTVALYGAAPGEPSAWDAQVIDLATRLAAIAVQRDRNRSRIIESEARYRDLFENANDILYTHDLEGRFTSVNTAGLKAYGLSAADVGAVTLIDIVDPAWVNVAIENIRRKSDGPERSDPYEVLTHRRDGSDVWVEVNTRIVKPAGQAPFIQGIARDVTERKRAEDLVTAQRQLLEMVALGAPLTAILSATSERVEALIRGGRCSIMVIAADGVSLTHTGVVNLRPAFRDALDGLPIAMDGASPGACAATGKRTRTADIATDTGWRSVSAAASAAGINACWSTPIRGTSGTVFGVLSVYFTADREPHQQDLNVIEMATHIAGIAIERKRIGTAVRSRTAELETTYRQLVRANRDLEDSKIHLEEQSVELERALAAEQDRARRDPLTGLLNHAGITDALRECTAGPAAGPIAIAMVDVDGLKAANDTYGHQIGDAVLVMVAQKLSRDGAVVGRYGGDEFVAILPDAGRPGAEAYRDAVLAALREAGLTDPGSGASVPVVASIGIAVYPEEATAADDLIRLSDSAMYAARRERPADPAGRVLSRTLGGDRAAKIVGEIVPLLTSAGNTEDKLRLVAHRLSVGAGYDGVHFIIDDDRNEGLASSSFARVPEQDLEQWDEDQASNIDQGIARILDRTRRPIVIDDLGATDLLNPAVRSGLIATGLRSCLIAPMLWEDTLIGAMSVASKRPAAFSVRDAEFVLAVATQVTAIVQMSRLLDQLRASSADLRAAHESTVLMLASAAEAHDRSTGRHLERVRLISEAIADELGYDEAAAKQLGMAAILHDIGKIRVPDAVLGSSQSLADAEWVLMKQHTVWGSAFLNGQPGFELAAMVARCHHERWDGAGYPDSLAGEDIPEAAQITTVADSFDAMTNDRPYRDGRPISDAVAEIVACSGTQFSPRVVDALVRLFERGALDFLHAEDEQQQRAA